MNIMGCADNLGTNESDVSKWYDVALAEAGNNFDGVMGAGNRTAG